MAAGKASGKASLLQNERVRLGVCFLGVFVCYFYYGILQETITRGDYSYGNNKEKFRFATTLVFIQCIINAIFAKILIHFFEGSKTDHTQSWLYGACSLSYLGAMVSSNSALLYVNYPTQVCLLHLPHIPSRGGGGVVRCAFCVGGLTLFFLSPHPPPSGAGEVCSLMLDGLTGVAQDHMRNRFQTGPNHMMLHINLWSILVLGISVLWTGEIWDFLSFAERFPNIYYTILLFGITSALGQTFIFMTVVFFGPLTCSIITTTRKFFTILGSVILFGNEISNLQWVGTVLVFFGLGLDAKFGKGPKKTPH
uniref:Solute carrier family 35 member B1 n=1 Tax=Paramormyrops kingsleyae TaxID=1676925 RepID=A0A3B3T7T9_9TELE